MEVSKVERAKTHVVMGGGEATAFSMASTAEFFTILSDTLYSNKVLAVVREVICNAWDAHIEAGITDTPIEVKITDGEILIRDFGKGIANEDMPVIYCQYGNSTKVKDEKQTGGFGLGCKAPFAYSDHFSVTSRHKGTKTIYSISRGGAETKGIPDLREMVKMDTEESGLTVKIPLKKSVDQVEFTRLARQIIVLGGIRAKLDSDVNYERETYIDYTNAQKLGFMLFIDGYEALKPGQVFAKYGNVVYPVQSDEPQIKEIVRHLENRIPDNSAIVLCCRPNSIGVTPSRESLSYTAETIQELKRLCNLFTRKMEAHLPTAKNKAIETIADGTKIKDIERAIDGYEYYHEGFLRKKSVDGMILIDDHREAAKALVISQGNIRKSNGFSRKFCRFISKKAEIGRAPKIRNFWKNGMANKTWPRAVQNGFNTKSKRRACNERMSQEKQNWLWNTRLIRRAALQAGLMENLFVIQISNYREMYGYKFTKKTFGNTPENEIVIAQSREEAKIYIGEREQSNTPDYSEKTFVCASIPRSKKGKREIAKKMFEELGFKVHTVEVASPRKPKVQKKAVKFSKLSDMRTRRFWHQSPGERDLEEPKFFLAVSSTHAELGYGNRKIIEDLIFCLERNGYDPEQIAVVRTKIEVKKLQDQGVPSIHDEIASFIKFKANLSWMQYAFLMAEKAVAIEINSKKLLDGKEIKVFKKHYAWSNDLICAESLTESIPNSFFEFCPFFKSNKENVKKWAEIIKTIKPFFEIYPFSPSKDIFESAVNWFELMENIEQSAYEKWKDELIDVDGFNDRFKGLSMIASGNINSDAQQEVAIMTIRNLVKVNGRKLKEKENEG